MTAINTGSSLFATHYPHAVYLRQSWADAWQHQPFLYCDALDTHAAPEIDRAQLTWRYGVGMQPGTSQFLQWLRTDITDWFVKVVIDQGTSAPIVWYGLITDEFDRRDGAQVNEDGSRIPSGNQQLVAVGLESLLARVMIDRSTVKTTDGEVEVGRAIPFNIGQGATDSRVTIGNATTGYDGSRGTRIFAAKLDPTNAAEWTAPQIIEYLLAYYGPADATGTQIVPFALNPTGQTAAINWQTPRLDVHGRTLLDILNALIDRRRMASWRITVSENGGVTSDDVLIDVFSLTADPITLPGGSTHPANTDTRTLDFDTAFDIRVATVRTSTAHRFDQIVARGERRTGTATLSNVDGTLFDDWEFADEQDYNAGGTATDGYDSLDLTKRERRHIEARSADRLERVYRWFKLVTAWDGLAGDGLGGEEENPVCPTYTGLGGPGSSSVDFWRPGLRILPRLPLLTAHDYTGSKIPDGVTSTTPDGSLPEQRRLLAAFRVASEDDGGDDAEQWILGENLATPADEETGDGGRDWSVSITNQTETAGVILDVSRPGWQHVIAANEFEAADDADTIEAELRWGVDMLITCAIEFDDHVEARYPADADVDAVRDAVRRLIIPVPGARLDYVTPQTVVDVEGGELKRSDGGFVNDDRERLADIARAAWGWYGTDRRILDLEYRQLSGLFRVGLFITTIGADATEEAIGTPITSVRWNLLAGTTGIQTSFNALDLTAIASA